MRVQHEIEEIFENIKPDLQKIIDKIGSASVRFKIENNIGEMVLIENLGDGEEAVHKITLYPEVKEHTEYKVSVYRRNYDDILVG